MSNEYSKVDILVSFLLASCMSWHACNEQKRFVFVQFRVTINFYIHRKLNHCFNKLLEIDKGLAGFPCCLFLEGQ